jgi:hypothetical protein
MLWSGSTVGIVIGYWLDGRESNPGGGGAETGPGAHPASSTMGTGSFPGVENGRGVTLTPHPSSVEI